MANQLEQSPSYVHLATTTYSLAVDAAAVASERVLAYNKSVFEVLVEPYRPTTGALYRELTNRVEKIVDLTVEALAESASDATQFGEALVKQTAGLRTAPASAVEAIAAAPVAVEPLAAEPIAAALPPADETVPDEPLASVVTAPADPVAPQPAERIASVTPKVVLPAAAAKRALPVSQNNTKSGKRR